MSRAYLEKVKEEIESLESKDKKDKRDLLPEKLKLLSDALNIPQLQQARARLDLLARDWSATGNYFWMKRQIDQKIGPAPKK